MRTVSSILFCLLSLYVHSQNKRINTDNETGQNTNVEYKIEEYSILKSSLESQNQEINDQLKDTSSKKVTSNSLKKIQNIIPKLEAYQENVQMIAKQRKLKINELDKFSEQIELLKKNLTGMKKISARDALQSRQQNLQLISNLLKRIHESTMSVIRNTK